MVDNIKVEKSGQLARLAAFLIDTLIYMAILAITVGLIFIISKILSIWRPFDIDSDLIHSWVFGSILTVLPLYYAICLSSKFQATPGKYIMGIYVATFWGKKLHIIHALLRYFACFYIPIVMYIDISLVGSRFAEAIGYTIILLLGFFAIKPYDLVLFTRVYKGDRKSNLLADIMIIALKAMGVLIIIASISGIYYGKHNTRKVQATGKQFCDSVTVGMEISGLEEKAIAMDAHTNMYIDKRLNNRLIFHVTFENVIFFSPYVCDITVVNGRAGAVEGREGW